MLKETLTSSFQTTIDSEMILDTRTNTIITDIRHPSIISLHSVARFGEPSVKKKASLSVVSDEASLSFQKGSIYVEEKRVLTNIGIKTEPIDPMSKTLPSKRKDDGILKISF